MLKLLNILCFVIILLLINSGKSFAIYDPTTLKNNIFGIHILFPSELSDASHLVNSSGGDWGYVTIPIQSSDRNLSKWQEFMDNCRRYHLIPIIRIATTEDYFNKGTWSKPTEYDLLDFVNFLNDLNWPVKNRYVVIYNETNRGDEWGGKPDAGEYAKILEYAALIFHETNEDFFVIAGGLDNASANVKNQSIDDYTYMNQMNDTVNGIFEKIDGLASHSYPNPAFAMPPSFSREGIYSYYYQQELAYKLSGKKLPVFITETGWSSEKVTQDKQAQYYIQSFTKFWNKPDLIAVTPFILNSQQGAFNKFSFFGEGKKNKIYYAMQNLNKIKGEPILTPEVPPTREDNTDYPAQQFKPKLLNDIFDKIKNPQKIFFKWILGI